jgi:hypothetical protein
MILVGSMCLVLALLAGFAAVDPSKPQRGQAIARARGPLIEANEHPEWKQFLVRAAYRRAEELERLRDLPAGPMIVEEVIPPEAGQSENLDAALASPEKSEASTQNLAALPPEHDREVKEDITASIDEKPSGVIPVEIGASSSAELPLIEQDDVPEARQPETLQKLHDNPSTALQESNVNAAAVTIDRLPQSKPKAQPRKQIARAKKKPPAKPAAQPTVPGLLSTIFGENPSPPQ